jgi:hypothetical protein
MKKAFNLFAWAKNILPPPNIQIIFINIDGLFIGKRLSTTQLQLPIIFF